MTSRRVISYSVVASLSLLAGIFIGGHLVSTCILIQRTTGGILIRTLYAGITVSEFAPLPNAFEMTGVNSRTADERMGQDYLLVDILPHSPSDRAVYPGLSMYDAVDKMSRMLVHVPATRARSYKERFQKGVATSNNPVATAEILWRELEKEVRENPKE